MLEHVLVVLWLARTIYTNGLRNDGGLAEVCILYTYRGNNSLLEFAIQVVSCCTLEGQQQQWQ